MGIWPNRVNERAKRFAMILFFGFERIVFGPRFLVASAVFFPIVSTSSFLQKHTTYLGVGAAPQLAPHKGGEEPGAEASRVAEADEDEERTAVLRA